MRRTLLHYAITNGLEQNSEAEGKKMIYSQLAIFMLRVFNMAQHVALTPPTPSLMDYHPVSSTDHSASDQKWKKETGTRWTRIAGDVQIGALFSIHEKKNGSDSCGKVWEQYGMHRTEVALKTIEEINNDTSILANVRLGIDIRDDCWTERRAMEETIEFIRGSIGSAENTCPDSSSNHKLANHPDNKTANLLLAAVVGPGNSDMSISTHNLLQVFRIPQVGYSATTTDLSDKINFGHYLRLVPSDKYQAQALISIAVHFKWTYVIIIYSKGNYGEKGFEQLQKAIEKAANVCVATSEKIDSLAPPEQYDNLLKTLDELKSRPPVIICFCEGRTITELLAAIKRRRMSKGGNETDYQIGQLIGSESWSDRKDVVKGYEDVATGGISLRIYSPTIKSFDKYYWQLKPSTNKNNPWFYDFWEEKFNCSLQEKTAHMYRRKCTGQENLRHGGIPQDPKLSQVINSIYTVAYGLDAMYRNVCLGYFGPGLCPNMKNHFNGTELLNYMLNVRFNDSHGQEIYFDHNGDPPARYEILSYQGDKIGYVKAGEWRSIISMDENGTTIYKSNLTIFPGQWLWYNGMFANESVIKSICSEPCTLGQVKMLHATKCCFTCVPCADNEYLVDETTCKNCSLGDWPTDNRSACFTLEIEYLRSGSPEAIVVMVLSCIGILATIYTTAIFARFNTTPVVKATTRELSYIILVGCFLCYATTFVIVIRPNTATCYILRILPGFAFAMIYGALLTKTNRIARILAGSKKRILTKKPRFLSTRAQVVITWILVSVELVIITAILIYEPAKADYDYSLPRRVLLVCKASTLSFLAPFGFDFFLITLCTLYAVKTRNLPENFNEAKFIGFTMYTTCIIWLAFITIYFGSNNKGITMCLSFTLSASVALVLLFFPKLYIILFQPHKNVRSSYATTKVIRCHFGTSPSTHDSHRTSSSGVKTTSTVSRPSSKISSTRSEIGISDSSGRLKKTYFRDSVHVTIPQTAIAPKENAKEIAPDEETPAVVRPFRSSVYFQNELSIIEESMMSHDDSLQSQSHLASSGQGSGDQQAQLIQTSSPCKSSKSEFSQTDADIFEEYISNWVLERRRGSEAPAGLRRRSMSLSRVPSFRRRSDASLNETNPESEEKQYQFKRTYTEYRKGSKRIKKQDGSRMKIPRASLVQELMTEQGADQLAALIARRRSSVKESDDDTNTSGPDASFLMRVQELAPIDAVITTSVEEFRRKNTLRRRRRQLLCAQMGPDSDMGDSGEGSDAETSQQYRPSQRLNSRSSFGDLMASTIGGAFQTFIGTAVPVDEKQDFYMTTQVIEEADEEAEYESEHRSSPSQDPMLALGSSDHQQQPADSSNGSLFTGPNAPSKIDRKGSLLSRLGHSIRKKIRRLSGDAAAGMLMQHTRIHISHEPRSSTSRQNSTGAEPSITPVPIEEIQSSEALIECPPQEWTESPFGSPARRASERRQQKQRRRDRYYRESIETDSGISRLERTMSFDEDTSSSKGSSTRRSRRSSYQRSKTMNTLTPSPSELPNTTITTATIVSSGTASSSVDAGFVDSQSGANELETLLQSQGLEPVEFSHSTLV